MVEKLEMICQRGDLQQFESTKSEWSPDQLSRCLFIAAHYHHSQLVESLILNGADPNYQDINGRTALFVALKSPATQEILLKHGARIDHQDHNGWTCLMHASKLNLLASVQFLLKNGADLTLKDYGGSKTALQRSTNLKIQDMLNTQLVKQRAAIAGSHLPEMQACSEVDIALEHLFKESVRSMEHSFKTNLPQMNQQSVKYFQDKLSAGIIQVVDDANQTLSQQTERLKQDLTVFANVKLKVALKKEGLQLPKPDVDPFKDIITTQSITLLPYPKNLPSLLQEFAFSLHIPSLVDQTCQNTYQQNDPLQMSRDLDLILQNQLSREQALVQSIQENYTANLQSKIDTETQSVCLELQRQLKNMIKFKIEQIGNHLKTKIENLIQKHMSVVLTRVRVQKQNQRDELVEAENYLQEMKYQMRKHILKKK